MITKCTLGFVAAFAVSIVGLQPACAGAPNAPWLDHTEKLHVEKTGGKAAFALAEYTGTTGRRSNTSETTRYLDNAFGNSKDKFSIKFTVLLPGQAEPVAVNCAGGASNNQVGGLTFKAKLTYHCDYVGGGVPAGTRLDLALSDPGLLKGLEQPQRTGDFVMGDLVLRAETRQVDTNLIASPGVLGYVISKDKADIAGISMVGWKKTIYLPKSGDPDRTAAALLALALYYFNDPANGG